MAVEQEFLQTTNMVGMAVGDVVVVEVGDADAPSLKRAGDGCAGVDEDRPAALGNDQAGGIILSRKGGADSSTVEFNLPTRNRHTNIQVRPSSVQSCAGRPSRTP